MSAEPSATETAYVYPERWSALDREAFEERAAIMEFEARQTRDEAERAAALDIENQRRRRIVAAAQSRDRQ